MRSHTRNQNIYFLAGINIENSGSTDVAMLHEDLIDVMPAVEEANSISEELDKRVKFEIILIAPNMLGKLKHKHEGFEDRDKTSSQPEVLLNICYINGCINVTLLKIILMYIYVLFTLIVLHRFVSR